ncbi:hypothetical protein SORBI_3005G086900 [Sorghum bicolor]|uniref:Uncharacterized protein n=1 Tax=Sorghum bicolor TaxID=4558 RepID=A0A1Z5RHF8_SORBI|nr:hypothetical protein SORBI_3005G086900 [Sorghum bicolor]
MGIPLRPANIGRYSPSHLATSRPRLDIFLRPLLSSDAARSSLPLLQRCPSVLASPSPSPCTPAAPPSLQVLGLRTDASSSLHPVHLLVHLFIRRSSIRPCQLHHCSVTGWPHPKIQALGDV